MVWTMEVGLEKCGVWRVKSGVVVRRTFTPHSTLVKRVLITNH